MQKVVFFVLLFFLCVSAFSQNFEGWIAYKMEMPNPFPKKISDSQWQAELKKRFGERGYILQKYYYKNNLYISEIEAGAEKGYQAFNPKDYLLYSWKQNSDTAITVDSRKVMDAITEVTHSDEEQMILGIPCKSLVIKSALGKTIVWYNPAYLKMDSALYTGHVYGHWERILQEIKCLPLKIEQETMMMRVVQTVLEYKQEPVADTLFVIPAFKIVIANPVN